MITMRLRTITALIIALTFNSCATNSDPLGKVNNTLNKAMSIKNTLGMLKR